MKCGVIGIGGFSLLETVIAIFVIGFGVMGWLELEFKGLALMTELQLRNRAFIMAHQTAEELQGNPSNFHHVIEEQKTHVLHLLPKGTLMGRQSGEKIELQVSWDSKKPSEPRPTVSLVVAID